MFDPKTLHPPGRARPAAAEAQGTEGMEEALHLHSRFDEAFCGSAFGSVVIARADLVKEVGEVLHLHDGLLEIEGVRWGVEQVLHPLHPRRHSVLV